ncbi:MAG: biotin--[acetyl-CoA-carboxylase] ligase [Acidimicrobiia bacterium]
MRGPAALGPVERVASIDSTNAELLRRARRGDDAGVVLVADVQTAGRGRLGRVWEAAPGSSLLVSLLLRPDLEPGDAHLATVAAALAARAACRTVAGVDAGIKWPNDLVAGDRKLAGLLTEAVVSGRRLDALVVGMGLNVTADAVPDGMADSATSLAGEAPGGGVRREAVLEAWLVELAPRLASLASPSGRRALAAEHRDGCVTLGRRVRVERGAGGRPADPLEGAAVDLTDAGHLVVDDGATRHVVAVGDVVHVRPA